MNAMAQFLLKDTAIALGVLIVGGVGLKALMGKSFGAETFNAEEVAIAVEKTSGGDTLYGIKYLDLGYEHTEWFMSKTDRDLHLDMYVEGVYSHIHYNSAEGLSLIHI